jgi:hypothetical protein
LIDHAGGLPEAALALRFSPSILRRFLHGLDLTEKQKLKLKQKLDTAETTPIRYRGTSKSDEPTQRIPTEEEKIEDLKSGLDRSPDVSAYSSDKNLARLPDPEEVRRQRSVDLGNRVRAFIGAESDSRILTVAGYLRVQPATIRKVLNGIPLTHNADAKLRAALEEIGASADFDNMEPVGQTRRLLEAHKLYKELGTLRDVAVRMRITRERVRQLLVKGTRLGLFEYKGHDYPYVEKAKLIEDYLKHPSLQKIARINGISTNYLKKLFTAYSITDEQLRIYRGQHSRERCIFEYNAIKEQLGHDPSTGELQRLPTGRVLDTRIRRLWGSVDAFRDALNIPKPRHPTPHWLEPRRQIAFIARLQHLDTIREYLIKGKPMSASDIANESKFRLARVQRLLRLLVDAGEVQKHGSYADTKYSLTTTRCSDDYFVQNSSHDS